MLRKLTILTLLMLVAFTSPARVLGKDKPQKREGDYNVSFAGFVKGGGTATVIGDQVRLHGDVTSVSGEKGELNAGGLTIVGTHFSGTGNVLGKQATISGRLDAPDSDREKAIKGVRLVGTIKTEDGRYAKVVGYIPALANASDGKDDDGPDRGRSKGKGK